MPRIESPVIPLPPPVSPAHGPASPAPVEPFSNVLNALGKELERGEVAIRQATLAARYGQDLTPAQAIGLQVQVNRFNEVVDLSAKLVDRATNGIKTVVQGQGQ
jgi:hypothetical protein